MISVRACGRLVLLVLVVVLALVSGTLGSATGTGAPAQPRPLRVFTFSQDSIAGFEDEALEVFRNAVSDELGSVMELAYGRDDAELELQYLGHGELTLALDVSGKPAQHLFRIDEKAPQMWALLRARDHTKAFSIEGRGARDIARLARSIADWVKSHRSQLRELLSRPGG